MPSNIKFKSYKYMIKINKKQILFQAVKFAFFSELLTPIKCRPTTIQSIMLKCHISVVLFCTIYHSYNF